MSRNKLLALAAAVVLVTALTGCGGNTKAAGDATVATSMNSATRHVDAAIAQLNKVVDSMPTEEAAAKAGMVASAKSLDASAGASLDNAQKELKGAAEDVAAVAKLDSSGFFTAADFKAYQGAINNMLKQVETLQADLRAPGGPKESTLASVSQGLTEFGVHHAAFLGALTRMKTAAPPK
jgi:hypothetical protein